MKRAIGLFLAATFAAAGPSLAGPPNLQTPSPVIYLADNLDEADNLGWCIDTVGRGLSDRLHAHSCKPRGGDVQFSLDAQSGQLRSVAFDALCATYAPGEPASSQVHLLECDAVAREQAFSFRSDNMTIRPASTPGLCLSVGENSRSAGPFMSRDLLVTNCAETAPPLKQWIIKP